MVVIIGFVLYVKTIENLNLYTNFKKLNEAVGKLLDWQENYYKQIEYMVETIQQTNVAVDASSKIIGDISDKYQKTYKLTEDFQGAINILNDENKVLQSNIENFAQLAEKATDAFPAIEKNLNDLTDGFTQTIVDSLKTISDSHTQQTSETASMMEKLNTPMSRAFLS